LEVNVLNIQLSSTSQLPNTNLTNLNTFNQHISSPQKESYSKDTVRINNEIYNAQKKAALESSAFGLWGIIPILPTIYYALKNPLSMAKKGNKDQQKEAIFEKELEKQKQIKKAELKASCITSVASLPMLIGTLVALKPYINKKIAGLSNELPASSFNKRLALINFVSLGITGLPWLYYKFIAKPEK